MNTALIDLIELVNDFVLNETKKLNIEKLSIENGDVLAKVIEERTRWDDITALKILDVMPHMLLQTYVGDNYNLDDIFSDFQIKKFADEKFKTYGAKNLSINEIPFHYDIDDVFDDDDIVEYVRDNLNINEIFDTEDIEEYVKDNYGIRELFDEDDILNYLRDNYDVDNLLDIDIRWKY